MTWVGMGEDPADVDRFLRGFASPEDGAVLLFLGTVRNHNLGRAVEGLEYEAYREMGEEILARIAREAETSFQTQRIGIYHRTGTLAVGEVSTVIAVATPHREEAYGASRYIIEEIKKRLPVWKKEMYVEGDASWVQGRVPPTVEGPGSREAKVHGGPTGEAKSGAGRTGPDRASEGPES